MPKVSIIIPTYNYGKYLSECLDSVLNQTFTDFEVIIIDDGSTDSTPEIIKKYAASDERIIPLSQKNSGKPSVARNLGISRSRGEYITFLDADDIYEPTKLERECKLLDRFRHVNVVFADMYTSSEDGRKYEGTYFQQQNFNFMTQAKLYLQPLQNNEYLCNDKFYIFMSCHNPSITMQTVMIRKSRLLAEKEWFPEDLTIAEDIDLWFRLAKGEETLFINEPLSCYRMHAGSITKHYENIALGNIAAYSRNYERAVGFLSAAELKIMKNPIVDNSFELGYFYKGSHRYREAISLYTTSLKWNFSLKTLSAIIKTIICRILKSLKFNYNNG